MQIFFGLHHRQICSGEKKKKISLTVIFGIDLFIISVRAILVFWQYLSPKSVMQ